MLGLGISEVSAELTITTRLQRHTTTHHEPQVDFYYVKKRGSVYLGLQARPVPAQRDITHHNTTVRYPAGHFGTWDNSRIDSQENPIPFNPTHRTNLGDTRGTYVGKCT